MVVLANGTISRNSGRRTARFKSKRDDGVNPWIRPRPSNGASFASRNTSLAGVGVLPLGPCCNSRRHSHVRRKAATWQTKGKHYEMCVRRSDTYSEEMGQSDLSRYISHGAQHIRFRGF